jgi:hypothetical protein
MGVLTQMAAPASGAALAPIQAQHVTCDAGKWDAVGALSLDEGKRFFDNLVS